MKYISHILRKSPFNRSILRFFVSLHNTSYRAISFFCAPDDIHPKHKIQNYHEFFVSNISATDSVLDIGSGDGQVAYDLAEKARMVTGIDIAQKNIASSGKKFKRENLDYILGDATSYTFDKNFDVITLSNVLEHIEHRVRFLQDIQKLAPKILIRVPLITRDWISVWKKENGFPYRLDDTHFIEYTEEDFAKEMHEAGLRIESFYVKFGEMYAVTSPVQVQH